MEGNPILEKRFGFKKFTIEVTDADQEILDRCMADITLISAALSQMRDGNDAMILEYLKDGVRKIDIEKIRERLNMRQMTEQDLMLFALSIWIKTHHGKYPGNMTTFIKLLSGGSYPISQAFEKDGKPNCYETSVFTSFIAQQQGIPSKIEQVTSPLPTKHQFVVAEIPFEPVIDPWFDQIDGPGFFPTKDIHTDRVTQVVFHQCSNPEKG